MRVIVLINIPKNQKNVNFRVKNSDFIRFYLKLSYKFVLFVNFQTYSHNCSEYSHTYRDSTCLKIVRTV